MRLPQRRLVLLSALAISLVASATSISYAQVRFGASVPLAANTSWTTQNASYVSPKKAAQVPAKRVVVSTQSAPKKSVSLKKSTILAKKVQKPTVVKKAVIALKPAPALTNSNAELLLPVSPPIVKAPEKTEVNAPIPQMVTPQTVQPLQGLVPQTATPSVPSQDVVAAPLPVPNTSLIAAQPRIKCPILGATVNDPSNNTTLTCAPFTKMGALNPAENRWSLVYRDSATVHTLVTDALVAYNRSFPTKADQQIYETKITTDLEFGAFIDLLVNMDKKAFPGFADILNQQTSLKDAIKPWANQLAQQRALPAESFNLTGEGFMIALGSNPTLVSQDIFTALFVKSEQLRAYADSVDHDYWLNFPNPSLTQITQRFMFIDSLLSLSDADAQRAYLAKAKTNAKTIYPSYATLVDSGQTIDQIMAPWVTHFADQLELYRGAINPIQEHTLIQAAITPPASIADFDVIISRDPRWAATSKAKAAAIGKASY